MSKTRHIILTEFILTFVLKLLNVSISISKTSIGYHKNIAYDNLY